MGIGCEAFPDLFIPPNLLRRPTLDYPYAKDSTPSRLPRSGNPRHAAPLKPGNQPSKSAESRQIVERIRQLHTPLTPGLAIQIAPLVPHIHHDPVARLRNLPPL